ncbi:MAG TPA: DMT family transporter [Candidatus Limnocylindria bacterium]|nr:DMT family transporter [Candidatus Limnocylindria bacterium]
MNAGSSRPLLQRERALGVALVIVSACGFGSGALFAKPIYAAGVDWLTLLCWRFLFAALFAWGWLLIWSAQRRALRAISRRRLGVLVLLGVLYVGNSGTYFAGLMTVPASLAALIVYLYPALVAVMSIRFARRLEGRRPWAALVLATAGVGLAVGGIDPAATPPIEGLLLMLASPFIYAAWIILAARLGGERPESSELPAAAGAGASVPPHDAEATTQPEETDSSPAAAIMLTATAIAWWLAAMLTDHPVAPALIPAEAWLPLVGVGLVATALALQTFYAGARRIGAAQASLVSTVEPVYTIVLATLLFAEQLTPIQLAGGTMVIVGVIIAQIGGGRPDETRLVPDRQRATG